MRKGGREGKRRTYLSIRVRAPNKNNPLFFPFPRVGFRSRPQKRFRFGMGGSKPQSKGKSPAGFLSDRRQSLLLPPPLEKQWTGHTQSQLVRCTTGSLLPSLSIGGLASFSLSTSLFLSRCHTHTHIQTPNFQGEGGGFLHSHRNLTCREESV